MNYSVSPLVSVIIPTYNRGGYLGLALQSILEQSYTNWEVIVIDNHSTDNTDEVLARFLDPRITFLKIQNNGVIAKSRNAGILVAKGEWIAFLDSDDWWTTEKLQVCYDSINDKVDLVYHDLEYVTDKPRLFRRKITNYRQVKAPVLKDLLLNGNTIANSSVLVRKNFMKQIGGINESLEMVASEDFNTWLRVAKLTDQFVYLPRKLGYYRTHDQSISHKDMSVSFRSAIAEFLPELSEKNKLKIEADCRYIKGRFLYSACNYSDAIENFMFVLCHGNVVLRIKSLILIVMTRAWKCIR